MEQIVDKVWEGSEDAFRWVRALVFGEFEENRPLSVVVTDALGSFVPGVGSVMTLRDLVAIILRLARHPEKREEVEEWILLIAMLLPLIITLVGLAAAGVGALVGAELGGFFRALTLLLVKNGGVGLKALVEFFQHHGYGDVVAALKKVQFAAYRDAVVKGLSQQIDKLIRLVKGLESKLRALSPHALPQWIPGRARLVELLEHCPKVVSELEALRVTARSMIPKALIELDRRLGALLAGNLRAATEVTHSIRAGEQAPAVAKLQARAAPNVAGQPTARSATPQIVDRYGQPLHNPAPPQPLNTRRVPQRRVLAAMRDEREYKVIDSSTRPVGAKPYVEGKTVVDNPQLKESAWDAVGPKKIKDGYPDLASPKPGTTDKLNTDYTTFSDLRPTSIAAGSDSTVKRIVSWDNPTQDVGAFGNRTLPIDGEAMRSSSAVKEAWNSDGQYVEIRTPPPGHPAWQEINELQTKAAGQPVPYSEELKMWEGTASSQTYERTLQDRSRVKDDWYLPGGEQQVFMDRDQLNVLKKYSDAEPNPAKKFISVRKDTNFPDFDPLVGNIVPKNGPSFEVVPLHEALPKPLP